MAETPEMESPSARQDCLVQAQEDSTSVELESRSASSISTTTTTTMATMLAGADATDGCVEQKLCKELIIVIKKVEDKRVEEQQPSDELCIPKKKKEDMNERTEKKSSNDADDSIEASLQESEEFPKTIDSQDQDIEKPTTPNVLTRKRPAGTDFLPIGMDIKRIGVEISKDQATQLRNDVRRLSPVLVSLRERTLGEVSLTPESCLFGDESDGKSGPTGNNVPEVSSLENDSGIQDINQSYAKKDNEEKVVTRIGVSPSATTECTNSDGVENNLDYVKKKLTYSEEKTLDIDVAPSVSSGCDSSDGTSKMHVVEATSLLKQCLVVLQSNIADLKKQEPTSKKAEESVHDVERSPLCEERRKNPIEVECDSEAKETLKKPKWQSSSSPMTRSKTSELMEIARSPSCSPVLKKCKVMLERISEAKQPRLENVEEARTRKKPEKEESTPVAVIGKLEENEEVVLTSSSCPTDNRVSHELDTSEMMPSSPEEIPVASIEIAEGIDTETETETGSDSSEVSPITSIRELRDVDVPSDQLPCSEVEPLCCVEAMAPIMTRLEAERPEPYTEDSAESLTLATGARDEVRSDGSDSGLGNEIPGDPGPAPAPESDSETSFLDRLPDDILSDKEKGVNQLDSFAPSSAASGTPGQQPLTSFRTLPPKSNLKRRLIDCMEGEESRSNVDEPAKKKRNIHFDAVTVYYFSRAQGFTCVPSQGGSTLGMSATHTHAERFSLSEHATEQRRIHRARLAQLRSERNCATNCVTETASSSEDPSDDTDEEPSDNEELDIDSYYFLQPVPTWQRRALLRAAGVRRIDAVEKDECRDIRASREHCGCGCKGYCDPESCPCSRANVKCQVDRPGFPCGCTRDGCANRSGRIEFNPVRVRTHFIHTLMRLELEKKQREEERGGDHDQVADNQGPNGRNGGGPLREMGSLGSVMDNGTVIGDACTMPGTGPGGGGGGGGGFTTLHYETNHEGVGAGVVTAGCQPEVPGTREDSLDLYAIRDDCYPSEDAVDASQSAAAVQRKLSEFSQAFQSFSPGGAQSGSGGGGGHNSHGGPGGGMSFQQPSYQNYGSPYASLPSPSRVPQFQSAQFQPPVSAPPNPAAFSHYGPYGGAQDTTSGALQGGCAAQVHQVPPPDQQQQQHQHQQHSSYDANVFAQDDAANTAQYTNLTNSVQPMNASVVQQMQGKLEPFSELLSGRYSYYGEMHEPQQQHHGTYSTHGGHGATGKVVGIVEPGQVASEQQSESITEDCDENFGEIIKKSMVETVSA